MGFIEQRDAEDGVTIHVHLSRRDVEIALAQSIDVQHADDAAEAVSHVKRVVVTIASI